MQTDWQRFLAEQGAQFSNNLVIRFSTAHHAGRSALDADTITPLTDLSIIEISGADAGGFLNAQFTTDISRLEENHAQLSAWCNPKGRVISNFFIFRRKAKYYLFLPTELKDGLCERLQRYVLRAAVSISDKDDELICVGLRSSHLDTLIEQPRITGFTVNEREKQRALVFGELAAMQDLWQAGRAVCSATATQHWQLLNSLAGIAWIGNDSSEKYLPQEINLDLIDGLDFNKGCYPGQEIVARVHYRGRVKARAALALVSDHSPPQVGDRLYAAGQEGPVGTVLNASQYDQYDGEHQYLLLCVIERGWYSSGEIHLGAMAGPLLAPQPLPYSVTIN